MKIDINCDIGESYGRFKIGNDEALIPLLTSCNIACGFHGGDPLTIERTITLALSHKVRIGAHPSYPDLSGFGRRKMNLSKDELKALIKYQIAALKGMVESQGGILSYVKPHGALYNSAVNNKIEAIAIIEAIREIDPALKLMGLAGSQIQNLAKQNQMPFIAEAFADRRYTLNGNLMARTQEGAVIDRPLDAVQQVLSIWVNKKVAISTDKYISLEAESYCIHGDNPAAIGILKTLREVLHDKGIVCGY